MKEIIITGIVNTNLSEEVYIDRKSLRDILIDELERLFKINIDYYNDKLYFKDAYVSLFVAEKEMSFDKMKEAKVLNDLGLSFDISYQGWSEWTIDSLDIDELTIGNHDLLEILRSYKGKYIALSIKKIDTK